MTLGLAVFFRYSTKSTTHGWEKIDELDFININNNCFAKDTVNRMKRQATDWKTLSDMLQNTYHMKDLYMEYTKNY